MKLKIYLNACTCPSASSVMKITGPAVGPRPLNANEGSMLLRRRKASVRRLRDSEDKIMVATGSPPAGPPVMNLISLESCLSSDEVASTMMMSPEWGTTCNKYYVGVAIQRFSQSSHWSPQYNSPCDHYSSSILTSILLESHYYGFPLEYNTQKRPQLQN